MPYMIETWDRPDAAGVRATTRAAHIAYLEANLDKLLAAGAKLADDPFTQAGVPGQIIVTRWRKAIFDAKSYIAK